MYNLKFGVETEATGLSRYHLRDAFHRLPYIVPISGCTFGFTFRDYPSLPFHIKTDTSITNPGCEVVTPILTENDLHLQRAVLRLMYDFGMRCDKSCGLHVHVGIPAGVEVDLDLMYANWNRIRGRVWRVFGTYRNRNKEYGSINFDRLLLGFDRYLALNATRDPHDTIEFRLFNGCLDFRYQCRAIRFACGFAGMCFDKYYIKEDEVDVVSRLMSKANTDSFPAGAGKPDSSTQPGRINEGLVAP